MKKHAGYFTRNEIILWSVSVFTVLVSYWISSLYTPLKWNYHGDWYLWHYLNRGILEGYEGGEK